MSRKWPSRDPSSGGVTEIWTHLSLRRSRLAHTAGRPGAEGTARALFERHVGGWLSAVLPRELLFAAEPETTAPGRGPSSPAGGPMRVPRRLSRSLNVSGEHSGAENLNEHSLEVAQPTERRGSKNETRSGHSRAFQEGKGWHDGPDRMACIHADPSTGSEMKADEVVSRGKARHLGLREYDLFATDFAGRYWFPVQADTGPLLPNVSKGKRTESFPLDRISGDRPRPVLCRVHNTRRHPNRESRHRTKPGRPERHRRALPPCFHSARTGGGRPGGPASQRRALHDRPRRPPLLRRTGNQTTSTDFFDAHPPTVYFLNGLSAAGRTTFDPPCPDRSLPDIDRFPLDWTGTVITAEAPDQRIVRASPGRAGSERHACSNGMERWVLLNDGSGETADNVVVERLASGRIGVELWHSKPPANPHAGVRVRDLEQVAQQAAKRRRHIMDRGSWHRASRRLDEREGRYLKFHSRTERVERVSRCRTRVDDRRIRSERREFAGQQQHLLRPDTTSDQGIGDPLQRTHARFPPRGPVHLPVI